AKRAFEYDDLLDDATQIATARSVPTPTVQPIGLDQVVGTGMRIGDAWIALLGQLELQLNRATFDTWLKGCTATRYADGVLYVRAKHPYASEWLRNHLQQLMDQSLSSLAGAPVRVHVLSESEAAA
ncbi:MAG TPA: DnaA N-terminal domain-containing protein, partial [Pseudoxanthomonas mexicana]|nr:DnaA N-terminal domain-containing protein [Pseudoxanthomonas mexicana]